MVEGRQILGYDLLYILVFPGNANTDGFFRPAKYIALNSDGTSKKTDGTYTERTSTN